MYRITGDPSNYISQDHLQNNLKLKLVSQISLLLYVSILTTTNLVT